MLGSCPPNEPEDTVGIRENIGNSKITTSSGQIESFFLEGGRFWRPWAAIVCANEDFPSYIVVWLLECVRP